MILIGDYVLKSNNIKSILNIKNGHFIRMEFLSKNFFLLAIKLRFQKVLADADSRSNITENTVERVFDPQLLDRLVPDLNYPCARFRQTLQLLEDICQTIPGKTDSALIGKEQYVNFVKRKRIISQINPSLFPSFEILANYFNMKFENSKVSFIPLTINDFMEIVSYQKDKNNLFMHVIQPLIRSGYLMSLGIPYDTSSLDYKNAPPPYVLTPKFLLNSWIVNELN